MRLALGTRIALTFAGSLGATALALFVLLSALATRQSERQAQQAVQTANQVLSRLIVSQASALQAQSRLLIQRNGIGPLIVVGDRATIDDFLREQCRALSVDAATLLGPDGAVLGASDRAQFLDLTPALKALPAGTPWSGVVVQAGLPRLAIWTPITDPASGQVQGVLIAFRTLDDALAQDLAQIVGARITVTWRGRPVAASHAPGADPGFVSRTPLAASTTDGALALTVSLPRESLLARFDSQRQGVLIVFLIALAVGLLAALRLSSNLTRPLEETIAAARLLRSGAWPEPLPARGQDELGLLQAVFNEMTTALHESQLVAIQALAATVDARDPYTAGHSRRVAHLARRLAQALELQDDQAERVFVAGTLHDIGKVAIPDSILLKPGKLLPGECAVMESHAVRSEEIVAKIPLLAATLPAIRHHHERWNGGGYPDGLAGERIPLDARILTLADAFDALTTDRPYRRGMTVPMALSEIARCSGTQFDPALVPVFLALAREAEMPVELPRAA